MEPDVEATPPVHPPSAAAAAAAAAAAGEGPAGAAFRLNDAGAAPEVLVTCDELASRPPAGPLERQRERERERARALAELHFEFRVVICRIKQNHMQH